MAGEKTMTMAEVAKTESMVVLDGKVYDVSSFIQQHPGGPEVLEEALAEDNRDATESFEDIGHSSAAREMLGDLWVANLDGAKQSGGKAPRAPPKESSYGFLVPVVVLVGVAVLSKYLA